MQSDYDVDELMINAEMGNAEAQFNLSNRYFARRTPADNKIAFEWLMKSANQGYATAQCALASYYEYGTGLEKDEAKAAEWFGMAAEQGYSKGQMGLALCYRDGIGVEKDESKAVEWFRKAAEQGLNQAMRYLAECYEHGIGVKKNKSEADRLYKMAKKDSDETLRKILESGGTLT